MDELDLDYWEAHPDRSDEDIKVACEAWVTYQRKTEDEMNLSAGHPLWWAAEAVMDAETDVELHWRLIRCLCSLVVPDDEHVVGMIAAGPLWTQFFLEGERALDRIESADADPVLLAALSEVLWGDEPVGPRIDRYLEACGEVPPLALDNAWSG